MFSGTHGSYEQSIAVYNHQLSEKSPDAGGEQQWIDLSQLPSLRKAIGARGPFHGDEYIEALARHFEKHNLTL